MTHQNIVALRQLRAKKVMRAMINGMKWEKVSFSVRFFFIAASI